MTDISFRSGALGEFNIGAVLGRALEVFKRGGGRFVALAALPALPSLLVQLSAGTASFPVPVYVIAALLQVFLYFLAQGASVYGAFQEMRGQSFLVTESLGKCMERIFPLVGAALLTSLGMMLGFVLLVIPGLFLAIIWSVTSPACIVERLGPIESIQRSAALTKGYRWKILALFLILGVFGWLASFLMAMIFGAIGGAVVAALLIFAVGAVWGAFVSIIVAVVYYELRAIKEGINLDQIISVFD
jgi:hypothetical protein